MPRLPRAVAGIVLLGVMSACGSPENAPGGIYDPFEGSNRAVHAKNVATDRVVIRPLAMDYVQSVSPAGQQGVANFRQNFMTPGFVVNDLLQFRFEDALANTFRFVVNTTAGMGGLTDVASTLGVPARETDFGATLAFWQVPEGAYLELPLLGPSTVRDATGTVVDFVLNPLAYAIPSPEVYAGTAAFVYERLGKRGRFAETVDSIYYDSADSYAVGRSAYLQNRRFELGGDAGATDPYLDPYGTDDAYTDPYLE